MRELLPGLWVMQDLHPVLVHFPIALFPLALVFWILGWRPAARLALYAATGFAVAALVTGFLAMARHENGDAHHEWIHVHRNYMIATLTLGAIATVFAQIGWKGWTIGALVATTGVLFLGADRGAYLVYGLGLNVQGHPVQHEPEHPRHEEPHAKTHGMMEEHGRTGSGTSWLPDSAALPSIHVPWGDWTIRIHGLAFVAWTYQGSDRGGEKLFSPNWIMAMASRELWGGDFEARAMLSLEPWTVDTEGYPLLLQTGEGLIDRQHAHDLFMELAVRYERELADGFGFEVYLAAVGEPALGPVAFPHRPSASSDPMAPLSHHWQDSTHISYGVLTAGVFAPWAKLEASWFNGHEPDQRRYDFDFHGLDSWSARLTVNPSEDWSVQVSHGVFDEPEASEPDVRVRRTTASVLYSHGGWDAAAIWGRNDPDEGPSTHAFLVEGNWAIDDHHTVFGRLEYGQRTGHDLGLAPEDETFGIGSLSLGYLYNFGPTGPVIPGVGIRLTLDVLDGDLEDAYGSRVSYGAVLFFRWVPVVE